MDVQQRQEMGGEMLDIEQVVELDVDVAYG
jgi:hypothetical protein